MEKYGINEFYNWLSKLNYNVPEEFQNELTAIRFYDFHDKWFEDEVKKLEQEKYNWLSAKDYQKLYRMY